MDAVSARIAAVTPMITRGGTNDACSPARRARSARTAAQPAHTMPPSPTTIRIRLPTQSRSHELDTIFIVVEVSVRDGTWTFDNGVLRISPGTDRRVHKLRKAMGERKIPAGAIAKVTFQPGKKDGRLRLDLRNGADPFAQVVGEHLPDDADPHRLTIDKDSSVFAEYFADEVNNTLEPASANLTAYLVPAPQLPQTATAGDGIVYFDGATIRLEWTEWVEEFKKRSGPQQVALDQLEGVEWLPIIGWSNGLLRFRVAGRTPIEPKQDPFTVTWGMNALGGATAVLATSVVAHLPHPAAPANDQNEGEAASPNDQDALLRRLRELADLHKDGALTDEEFAVAKQAVLRQL